MELTEKQERFCQAFIEFGEKGRAYRDAFDADAMNSNSVAVEANKMFKDPKITLRVKELQDEIRERNKVKIDDVLGVLADMIKFDIAEIYDENGRLKSIHDIPKQHREMINSIKVYEEFMNIGGQRELIGEVKEVKILNKLDVIEKFMKHLGGYEKDNNQKQTNITVSPLVPEEIKKINDNLESAY